MTVKVQRGVFVFGATEDSDTVTLADTLGSLSSAFVRVTNVQSSSGGPDATTAGNRVNADLGVTATLTDTATIQFDRLTTGINEDVRVSWEVWEYVGPSGGPNEFIVRARDGILMNIGVSLATAAIDSVGVVDFGDCAVVMTSFSSTATGAQYNERPTLALDLTPGSEEIVAQRVTTASRSSLRYSLVEFTGSNWGVEEVTHVYTNSGVDETETIADVGDWSEAFIFATHSTDQAGLDEIGWTVRPGATTTSLRFRMRSGGTVAGFNERTVAYVITNSELSVQHIDSITGSGTEFATLSVTNNVTLGTAVVESRTGLIGYADCAGSGTAYPRPFWNYRLTSTTNVEFWRGRDGQPSDWALQAIEFPQTVIEADPTVAADPAVAALTTGRATISPLAAAEFTGSASSDEGLVNVDTPLGFSLVGDTTFFVAVRLKSKTNDSPVFSKGTVAGATFEYRFRYVQATDRFVFSIWNNTSSAVISVSSSLSPVVGEWYVFALFASPAAQIAGIQGISYSGAAESLQITFAVGLTYRTTSANFLIGYDEADGRTGDVDVCQFRLWDRPVVDPELSLLLNGGFGNTWFDLAPVPSSLVGLRFAFDLSEFSDGTTDVIRRDLRGSGVELENYDATTLVPSTGGVRSNVRAGRSTADAAGQLVAVTSTTVSAGAATTAIDGTVFNVQGDVAASAGRAISALTTQMVAQPPGYHVADLTPASSHFFDMPASEFGVQGASAEQTWEVWFRADSAADAGIASVWDPGNRSGSAFRLRIDSGALVIDVADPGNGTDYTETIEAVVDTGTWYQVTFSADSANDRYTIAASKNGQFGNPAYLVRDVPGYAGGSSLTVTEPLRIGYDPEFPAERFDGQISRVRTSLVAAPTRADSEFHYNCGRGRWVDQDTINPFTLLPSNPFGANVLIGACEFDEIGPVDRAYFGVAQPTRVSGNVSTFPDTQDVPSILGDLALWWCADAATVTIDADVLIGATVTAEAGAATTAIVAVKVSQTDVSVAADTATAAAAGTVAEVVDATVTAQADTATADIDALRVAQTSLAVQAGAATADIDGEVDAGQDLDADVTAEAGDATTAIDAQRIVQTDVALAAQAATVTTDLDLIRQTDAAVEAGAALIAIDTDKISQTAVAVDADGAVVVIDVDRVRDAAVAVTAASATAQVLGQRIVQTAVTLAADAATADITVEPLRQTSLALQAGEATADIDGQKISQTTPVLTADPATTNAAGNIGDGLDAGVDADAGAATADIDAQRISVTATTVTADPATTAIDVDRVVQTSAGPEADAATVTTDADILATGTLAVEAGDAATTTDAQKVSQTALVLAADAATVTINAQVGAGVEATVTAEAGQAVVSIDADKISQTALALAADASTTAIDVDRVVQATAAPEAGDATVTIVGDRLLAADLALAAAAAVVSIDADKISQTALVLVSADATADIAAEVAGAVAVAVTAEAGDATADIDGQRISVTALTLLADPAPATLTGQRVSQTLAVLQADSATTTVVGGFTLTTALTLAQGAAQAVLTGQRVSQTTLALQAPPATAEALGEVAGQLGADAVAQAGPATALGLAQRVVQASAAVEAGEAVGAATGELGRSEGVVAVAQGAAVAAIDGQRVSRGTAALGGGLATGAALGQKVVQGVVGPQAAPATTNTDATVFQVQGVVAVVADPGGTTVAGQLVRQTDLSLIAASATVTLVTELGAGLPATVTAEADGATTDTDAQLIHLGAVVALAGACEASVVAALNLETTLALQAGPCVVEIVGQRISQTDTAIEAQPVRARATDAVLIFDLDDIPLVAYQPRTRYDVFAPLSEADVFVQALSKINVFAPQAEFDVYFSPALLSQQAQLALTAATATAAIAGSVE